MVVMTSQDGQHLCDARCYNAKWFTCSCICGGKNHGVGLRQAAQASSLDLSIYGDTPSEQAEGLRFELENEQLQDVFKIQGKQK